MTLGEKLLRLREGKGLSQYEVAERLGIKRPRYNSWEQDIAKPRLEMLTKLADFFEVSPEYLLGYDSTGSSVPDWATARDKRDFKKMLEEDEELMFDGVPVSNEDKEKIKRIVEALFWDAKEKNKKTYGRKKTTDE